MNNNLSSCGTSPKFYTITERSQGEVTQLCGIRSELIMHTLGHNGQRQITWIIEAINSLILFLCEKNR